MEKVILDIYIDNKKIKYKEKINKNTCKYIFEDNSFLFGYNIKYKYKEVECIECKRRIKRKYTQMPKLNKKIKCNSCRIKGDKNPMYNRTILDKWIEKYGKQEGNKKWKLYINEHLKGKNNPFYGKKHTSEFKDRLSKERKGKYCIGDKNPMYGKSVYDTWVENYGKETADIKWANKKVKQSLSNLGDKNPMYGKSVYDTWVENYGKETADIKMIKYRKSISAGLKRLKESDRWDGHCNKISNSLKGRIFTDEHRKKLRIGMLNHIKKQWPTGYPFQPNYNPTACKYFDKLMEEEDIHIRHALNGGEYHIKELGYFVDGFDKENNTVYEYDERCHFDRNGNLKSVDIKRQQEIQEFLRCKFIRIKDEKII